MVLRIILMHCNFINLLQSILHVVEAEAVKVEAREQ
jgi:hypothetical protein